LKALSISSLDAFRILDGDTRAISYGCNQEWFPTEWQRRAGCGSSVACNIFLYLNRLRISGGREFIYKNTCTELMEEIWAYVTPTEHGIPTTEMFCEKVRSYGDAKDLELECFSCNVSTDESARPTVAEMSAFLSKAISLDIPVAFLNLCNGEEQHLQRWHWVTIVSMEQPAPDSHLSARILDEGAVKTVDLSLWRDTTKEGGGFVYFTEKNFAQS
jgi:hypothetical protein